MNFQNFVNGANQAGAGFQAVFAVIAQAWNNSQAGYNNIVQGADTMIDIVAIWGAGWLKWGVEGFLVLAIGFLTSLGNILYYVFAWLVQPIFNFVIGAFVFSAQVVVNIYNNGLINTATFVTLQVTGWYQRQMAVARAFQALHPGINYHQVSFVILIALLTYLVVRVVFFIYGWYAFVRDLLLNTVGVILMAIYNVFFPPPPPPGPPGSIAHMNYLVGLGGCSFDQLNIVGRFPTNIPYPHDFATATRGPYQYIPNQHQILNGHRSNPGAGGGPLPGDHPVTLANAATFTTPTDNQSFHYRMITQGGRANNTPVERYVALLDYVIYCCETRRVGQSTTAGRLAAKFNAVHYYVHTRRNQAGWGQFQYYVNNLHIYVKHKRDVAVQRAISNGNIIPVFD